MKKLIIFGIIIVLLGVCMYLLLSRPSKNRLTIESLTPSQTLEGLSKALGISATLKDYNYADWKNADGEVFPLTGKEIIIGSMNINGIGKYDNIDSNNLSSVTLSTLAPLLQTTDLYFISHGFVKSDVNTSTEGTPPITSTFIGYENDKTKCVLRIDEQSDPFGNFACGVLDQSQYNLQKPFIKLFFGSKYYDEAITSFRVSKVEGNFARGSASGTYMGYEWIAKQTDNSWSIVWRGQEPPLCSETAKLGIPQNIYETCYLPDGTMQQ